MVHDRPTPYPMFPVAIAVNFVIVAIIYVLHQHNIKNISNTKLHKSKVYNESCDHQSRQFLQRIRIARV